MKKIIVDQEKCIGCGACVAIAPDTFDFNEDGLSFAKNDEITEDVKNAEEACPVYAISIEEAKCTCCDECTCGDECTCDENCKCSEDCTCGCKEHECECDECDCDECECDECDCNECESDECGCDECDCKDKKNETE